MKWMILILTLYCSNIFAQNKGEMIRIMKGNYYQALGVSSSASAAEIKTAYRQLAKVYHPDKQMNPANAKAAGEIMQRINEVYETLHDELRRKAYNVTLNIVDTVKPKTAATAAEAWEKWNFAEFKKPDTAKPEAAKPKAQTSPGPKAHASAAAAPATPEAPIKPSTEIKVQHAGVETKIEPKKPLSLMAQKAQKIYSEVNRCGSDFSKSIIDEFQ